MNAMYSERTQCHPRSCCSNWRELGVPTSRYVEVCGQFVKLCITQQTLCGVSYVPCSLRCLMYLLDHTRRIQQFEELECKRNAWQVRSVDSAWLVVTEWALQRTWDNFDRAVSRTGWYSCRGSVQNLDDVCEEHGEGNEVTENRQQGSCIWGSVRRTESSSSFHFSVSS